jgi:predicted nucleotidyltransferase
MLSKKDIEQIKNKIVSELRPQKIYIFGSYARENADEESDIDILVIMNTLLNPHQRNLQVKRLFPRRSFSMDAFVYTPEEALRYQNIPGTVLNSAVTRGKLLYG